MAKAKALVYVTRDIERALGMEPVGDYFIVTNRTEYSQSVHQKYPKNVFLIEEKEMLDTYDILIAGEKYIPNDAEIIVFKNTSRIEEFCASKKWHLLNPPSALAEKIENKITQVKWLGAGENGAEKYLPPHTIKKVSEIKLKEASMIQWAHGHTGDGTIFVSNDASGEKTLATLREKFPDREARLTNFVKGPIFTANICVGKTAGKNNGKNKTKNNILIGNISLQITGILPFTDNPWSTVGNDWSIPHSILNPEKIAQFQEIAHAVAERMQESGWLGLFGIDCIYDEERDNLHLIEVNARQPASVTYESQLQEKVRVTSPEHFKNQLTMFEAHVVALRSRSESKNEVRKLIEINDGAQIIERVTKINPQKLHETVAKLLREKNYTVIEYPNTKIGVDLLRIQSSRGIMESPNKFNARGKEILEIVTEGA